MPQQIGNLMRLFYDLIGIICGVRGEASRNDEIELDAGSGAEDGVGQTI